MPKSTTPKLAIHLDLLKPQSNPEKVFVKLIRWLLSTGRFIFIFVEALVLLAFIARFKLDADLQSNKEAIEQQLPYIESLKPFEVLIRQTQFKLATIDGFYKSYADYAQILKKISDQTPSSVKITSFGLDKNKTTINVNLNAEAQTNNDLVAFFGALKQEQFFPDVAITNISFEKGSLIFSMKFTAKAVDIGEKI